MCNKKIIFSLTSLMFLVLATPSFAADTVSATPTGIRKEMRQELKDVRKTGQAEIKEIKTTAVQDRQALKVQANAEKAARKEQVLAMQKKRIDAIYSAMLKEFNNRHNVLVQTQAKITARLNEKQSQGKNVTAATAKLAEFTAAEATYQKDLAAFTAKFNELSTTATPKTLAAELKAPATLVRTDLNSLRKILTDSLRLIVKA